MSCQERDEAIALHASGDLPAAEVSLLRAHLEGCALCRDTLESYRATSNWLRRQRSAPMDSGAFEELQRRIAERLPGRRQAPWLLAWLGRIRESNRGGGEPVLAIAGTALLALAALGALATRTPAPGPAVWTSPSAVQAPLAIPSSEESAPSDSLRIEMQTGDPNVRIIWFAAAAEPSHR